MEYQEYQPHINDEDIKFPHKKHEPFRIATFAVNKFGEIELLSHYNTDYLETFRSLVKNATLLVELTDDGYCFYKSSGAIASSALIHHPLEDSSGAYPLMLRKLYQIPKKEVNSLSKKDREKNFKD